MSDANDSFHLLREGKTTQTNLVECEKVITHFLNHETVINHNDLLHFHLPYPDLITARPGDSINHVNKPRLTTTKSNTMGLYVTEKTQR